MREKEFSEETDNLGVDHQAEQAEVKQAEVVKQVSEGEKDKGKRREATDDDEEEISEYENNSAGIVGEDVEGDEGGEDVEGGEVDDQKYNNSESEDFIPPNMQKKLRKKYKGY